VSYSEGTHLGLITVVGFVTDALRHHLKETVDTAELQSTVRCRSVVVDVPRERHRCLQLGSIVHIIFVSCCTSFFFMYVSAWLVGLFSWVQCRNVFSL